MPIRILKEEVVSQIAAGEVVERPASVVKELLENAIDAGATHITIRVGDSGKSYIEVADDGAGIPMDEVTLAISRHATSKLSTAEDLFHIRTLGFRGKALASIGSVSRLIVVSQPHNQLHALKIVIEGGQEVLKEQIGGVQGTVVSVENLFYNTPARLKFLKRDLTERQQIESLVTRYALAYPSCSFHLLEDDKPVLRTSGNGNQREILAQLYGVEIGRQMLEVTFKEEDFQLTGYISHLSLNRSNRRGITFFVNGRWVQDVALSAALVKAYQTYLMVGRYPMGVLFLELPPEEVDVNVHPAKSEVRFRQPDVIFSMVQRAARRAILAYSPVPHIAPGTWQSPGHQEERSEWKNSSLDWKIAHDQVIPTEADSPQPANSPQSITGLIPILRLIGQIGGTYLVAEGPDGLYLIDQHAAHERILYEKLIRTRGKTPGQTLLEPLIIQLPPQSAADLEENIGVLNDYGFHLEVFGGNSFRLRAIPEIFGSADPQAAIRCLVEDFEEDETPLQGMLAERLVARICKRMAVKGGKALNLMEQTALLNDLETCTSPRTCPHGRPTMIHLSVDLLEKQFGRRGARSI